MKLEHARPGPELGEMSVNMDNVLARASKNLTLSEKRLIYACIARNDSVPMGERLKDGGWIVRIPAGEYARTFPVSLDTAYEQLQSGSESLLRRIITTVRETHKGPEIYRFHWVSAAKYHRGEGWVEIEWFREVVPYLFGLRGSYTSYKLKYAAELRSIHSWNLLDVLESWRDKGYYTASLDEFHRAMDSAPSVRACFKDFRRRVIEPAIAELRERGVMDIEWKPKKAGRKVVGVEFNFAPSAQRSLF